MADNASRGGLTYKQSKAITALLATRTEGQAAIMAGISPRTLTRWLALPHFQAELRRAGIDAAQTIVGSTMRRLTQGQDAALDTLQDVMARGALNERRLAATSWLTLSMTLAELIDFEERIARLEKDLKP